jgi:hypothetical protein
MHLFRIQPLEQLSPATPNRTLASPIPAERLPKSHSLGRTLLIAAPAGGGTQPEPEWPIVLVWSSPGFSEAEWPVVLASGWLHRRHWPSEKAAVLRKVAPASPKPSGPIVLACVPPPPALPLAFGEGRGTLEWRVTTYALHAKDHGLAAESRPACPPTPQLRASPHPPLSATLPPFAERRNQTELP